MGARTGPVGGDDGGLHGHSLHVGSTPAFASTREHKNVRGVVQGYKVEGWKEGEEGGGGGEDDECWTYERALLPSLPPSLLPITSLMTQTGEGLAGQG